MNDVNTVAKVLASLHRRNVLHFSPAFITDLEREFEFPERSLDNAIDELLVSKPKVEIVGIFCKVSYGDRIYYINGSRVKPHQITNSFFNSDSCYPYHFADIVYDCEHKKIIKNRFGDLYLIEGFIKSL